VRLVFLDAATVDLGDVDISPLRRLGDYRSFDDTRPSQIVRHAAGADVVITNKCVLGEKILKALPCLKLICVAATGVNNVDLGAARRLGIAVTNVAGYSTDSVAEHTLSFILGLSHRLLDHQEAAAGGAWARSPHFAWFGRPYRELKGKTLGLIGYGRIGRRVARLARAFGMRIRIAKIPGRRYGRSRGAPGRFPLRDLLRGSDFVSLHCPLTEVTRHLMNARSLGWMRRGAFLLNLARGPIVEEGAVARALRRGRLGGYAADVLAEEPPRAGSPLLSRRLKGRVLLTPHVAWASREARQRLVKEMFENVRSFQNGRRRNRVV
jgi:glycerate dehydrogenase